MQNLKGSLDHGFYYTKSHLQLNAFCNSDWASCPDDHRSTTRFVVFLGDCLVSWSAKKQAVVSRSSTEAEYRSLSITTAELFWLRMLFKEIKIFLSVALVLWCDNISALALASNPVFHARTKHIEVDYHFVREKILNHDILIKFISTNDQVADVFTKGLSSARFLTLKSKLMVVSSPIILRGAVKVYKAKCSIDDSTQSKGTMPCVEDKLRKEKDHDGRSITGAPRRKDLKNILPATQPYKTNRAGQDKINQRRKVLQQRNCDMNPYMSQTSLKFIYSKLIK
jgi:hypothetical protein